MRGPIDYIIVGFEGNDFKGEILKELAKVVENGTIAVLDLAVIVKDEKGEIAAVELSALGDDLSKLLPNGSAGLVSDEDVEEVGDLLNENCAAGLLVVEQVWAKGLKQAIINANGVLVAEGRIHPDAYAELTKEKGAK